MDGYMIKLRNLAPVLLLALAPAAFAEDYRFEVTGAFDRDSLDGFGDIDTVTLSGTWYFKSVSTDGVPLAEAAFLGRASNLNVMAARSEFFFGPHLDNQAARVEYYVPGTMFYASAGLLRNETLFILDNNARTLRDDRWFGSLGVTPLDGLLVTTEFDEDGYDPNIHARHVGKLPNGHFYAGGVSLVDPDRGDLAFGLDFDYYLDDTTSLGAGYDDAGSRIELRAEKFFSKNWAAGITAFDADGSDGFGVHLTWRH
jgi:hypothetical protein